MARELGIDPASGLPISFDIADRAFVDAYLRHLHHPLEEQGVDFWWLDWQSGGVSAVPGLDPLWMLNHIHYVDSGRDGKRPLTFSRYAGIGSHRYPVGFSGDTIISWDSLDFQPYFTNTAANVGFGWWSHDVGGHMFGGRRRRNSPRAGSSTGCSPDQPAALLQQPVHLEGAVGVRAAVPPRHHVDVPAPATPARARALHRGLDGTHRRRLRGPPDAYHDYPEVREAYTHPNQALFGADLLIAPVVSAAEKSSHLATVSVWLPEGVVRHLQRPSLPGWASGDNAPRS